MDHPTQRYPCLLSWHATQEIQAMNTAPGWALELGKAEEILSLGKRVSETDSGAGKDCWGEQMLPKLPQVARSLAVPILSGVACGPQWLIYEDAFHSRRCSKQQQAWSASLGYAAHAEDHGNGTVLTLTSVLFQANAGTAVTASHQEDLC